MSTSDETKTKLRTLRDQLAWQTPRARARGNTPPTLLQHMEAAEEAVSNVYRLLGGAGAVRGETLDELCEDAIVEAHLALHEWERWSTGEDQQKKKAQPLFGAPPGQRRQHERQQTSVSVSVLRHDLRGAGDKSATVVLTARNISLGGMLMMASKSELPTADVGSVVHVTVKTATERRLHARALVTRRDDSGIAVRWLAESEADRAVVEAIIVASRTAK
jgi:PilZ domain-containing protein